MVKSLCKAILTDFRTQYGLYQEAVGLERSNDKERWTKATFWVFDAPDIANKPYEERVQFLRQLEVPDFVKIIPTIECRGKKP